MSMSTHVVGYAPPDEAWQRMKAVYDACTAAGVEVPNDVQAFFDYKEPSAAGVEVDISLATTEYRSEYEWGFSVDITLLPKHVKIVRFINSR